MQRSLLPIVGLALALTGCSGFPELDAQITDQARGTQYLSLQPLETVLYSPAPRIESPQDGADMMTAGLALQARGGAIATPGLIDSARASQERAERAIAETALARLRLQDDGDRPSLTEAQGLLDRAAALLVTAEAMQAEGQDDADSPAIAPPVAAVATPPDVPDTDLAQDATDPDSASRAIEARIAAILARTADLRDGRIDEQRRLLLERARALSGN